MRLLAKDNLILLGVVVALAGVAAVACYLPQARSLENLQGEIASQKLKLQTEAAQASVVPDLLRRVEEMKGRYRDFDRRLPKQIELGGFLREISSGLSEDQIVSQAIEPGSPKKEELYHTLPIIMKFKGSYLALAKFLQRTDGMERLTRVQRLTIAPSSDDRDRQSGELNIELQLNIYFTES